MASEQISVRWRRGKAHCVRTVFRISILLLLLSSARADRYIGKVSAPQRTAVGACGGRWGAVSLTLFGLPVKIRATRKLQHD
jgi:hypothetical protein